MRDFQEYFDSVAPQTDDKAPPPPPFDPKRNEILANEPTPSVAVPQWASKKYQLLPYRLDGPEGDSSWPLDLLRVVSLCSELVGVGAPILMRAMKQWEMELLALVPHFEFRQKSV